MVLDKTVTELRDKVKSMVDPTLRKDQARIKIRLRDGRLLERFVAHAVGSVENPMSDSQLEAKFTALADGILLKDRARHLMTLCRNAEHLDDAGDIARAAAAHT